MADEKKEAELLQKQYSGKPEELAVYLSKICLTKPGVVYQVLLILDGYSTLDVGLRFLNNVSEAVLYKTVVTYDGYFLCRLLFQLLLDLKIGNPPPIYNDWQLREIKNQTLYSDCYPDGATKRQRTAAPTFANGNGLLCRIQLLNMSEALIRNLTSNISRLNFKIKFTGECNGTLGL